MVCDRDDERFMRVQPTSRRSEARARVATTSEGVRQRTQCIPTGSAVPLAIVSTRTCEG